ncbi:MAG TPA: prepilin peptidase [Candidatus Paceibacterota bacterium]|nr:prepilin peptidase [Candidatus Paceibacterota bacterium]
MSLLFLFLFFLFGTIVGSFLNVVILRYNTGRTVVRGRSSCPHCGHVLGFAELIPILSFLFLRGRCLKCRSKISWQYPLVELLAGLIFAAAYFHSAVTGWAILGIDLIIFSLLIVILVYDLKHKIIPDGLVYAFIIISLIKLLILYFFPLFILRPTALDFLAGPIFFLPFFLLWYFSGGRAMGFGDAKLAAGIGWFLGFFGGLSAIVLGFWSGAALGIILLIVQSRRVTMKTEIPFAPFLILGLLLVYFLGWDVTGLSYFLH